MKTILNRLLSYDNKNHSWPQICVIFAASIGAFSSSALFTWTSPSIPILTSSSSHIEVITLEEASYFTVIPPIAMALSGPFISVIMDIEVIGRKNVVLFMAIPQMLAWLLVIAAQDIYILYLSRALSGLSDAILFSAVPTYVGEISTPGVRGSWGNLVAIGIYFGQFAINVVGAYCDILTTAMIFFCIPIVGMILLAFSPESPYFLLMKQKQDKALDSLKKLRWNENVEEEFKVLIKDVDRQLAESASFKELFTVSTNRKALLISIAIRGCQQLSGLPAFAVYTQYMFDQAGGHLSASTSAIIYTGILFVMTTSASFFVDKYGRKLLMVFSSLACALVLSIESAYFYISDNTNIDVSNYKWTPLAGMLIYIIVCSSGLGIVPTLMLGELFSTSVKSNALGVINIVSGFYILSVSKMFQVLTFNFGLYTPFALFAICCTLGGIFSYFYVPETKGKTLEEIQQELKGNRQATQVMMPSV